MNTQIKISYNGMDYILEYTRNAVRLMESGDFKLDEVLKKPMLQVQKLFTGAFFANHPHMKQAMIDDIFDSMDNKDEMVAKLIEMISETYNSLTDTPQDKPLKNVSWEVVSTKKKTQE